jgi:hypothetical protein
VADIFVSYKRADKGRVLELVQALGALQFECWVDHEIEKGEGWQPRIRTELDKARVVIGCWTNNAIRQDRYFIPSQNGARSWMQVEHEEAGGKLIGVFLCPERRLPFGYALEQAVDLSNWRGEEADQEFQALVRRIEVLATPRFVKRTVAALQTKYDFALHELHALKSALETSAHQSVEQARRIAEIETQLATARVHASTASVEEARSRLSSELERIRADAAIKDQRIADLERAMVAALDVVEAFGSMQGEAVFPTEEVNKKMRFEER